MLRRFKLNSSRLILAIPLMLFSAISIYFLWCSISSDPVPVVYILPVLFEFNLVHHFYADGIVDPDIEALCGKISPGNASRIKTAAHDPGKVADNVIMGPERKISDYNIGGDEEECHDARPDFPGIDISHAGEYPQHTRQRRVFTV